jgi:hypothetical protein
VLWPSTTRGVNHFLTHISLPGYESEVLRNPHSIEGFCMSR